MQEPQSSLALSVIIPFAGSRTMRFMLQSLVLQSLPRSRYETIIVVEQGHSVDELLDLFNLQKHVRVVKYARPPGFGGHSAGPMRNAGAAVARAERITFIDSDCIMDQDCLGHHDRDDDVVVCGGIRELSAFHQQSLAGELYRSYSALRADAINDYRVSERPEGRPAGWDDFYSGNTSLPRDLFDRAGGFDDSGFRCHDVALGYRLHLAGASFTFEPAGEVIHIEHPRSMFFRDEQARGWLEMAARHPELTVTAHDRLLILRESFAKLASRCERVFANLTRDIQGQRSGFTWVLPSSTDAMWVQHHLRGVPHNRVVRPDNEQYYLRLDRNCWDYSFLLPRTEPEAPRFSIVIPCHNAEATVARAIESAIGQTVQSFEIIVVDDGSTDTSLERVHAFTSDSRIRVLSSDSNAGLSGAMNRALEVSRGQVLVQLDSDDWLEPNALEVIDAAFAAEPGLGAFYGSPLVHADEGATAAEGWQIGSPTECLEYDSIQAPRAYSTDALRAVGGWCVADAYRGRYFEDRLMLMRVAETAGARYVPRAIYNVSVREDSLGRGNGMRAAAAKMAILWNEANRRQLQPSLRINGSFLRARLHPRAAVPPQWQWSVVIPARDGPSELEHTLRSWREVNGSPQIIVVDDGSTEPLESKLGSAFEGVTFVRLETSRGPAAARNAGASRANGAFLFFSDADHIVRPDVLALHERRHGDACAEAVVVGGVFGRRTATTVSPDLPRDKKRRLLEVDRFSSRFLDVAETLVSGKTMSLVNGGSPLWNELQSSAFCDSWLARWGELILQYGEDLTDYPFAWLRTGCGNLSLSRAAFERLNGFDETFITMEDWEFGLRAHLARMRIICAPEAEPLHQVHPIDPQRSAHNRVSARRLRQKHSGSVDRLLSAIPSFRPPGAEALIAALTEVLPEATRPKPARPVPPCYALTFDDGPHPVGTPAVLDALALHDARATFFVLGAAVKRYRDLCRRAVAAGHEIGVHGWQHAPASTMSSGDLLHALADSVKAIEDATGEAVRYCRPPYGLATHTFRAAARRTGLQICGWDVGVRDWASRTFREIVTDIALQTMPGNVYLFHDATGDPLSMAEAVRWLTAVAARHGFRSLPMSEFDSIIGVPPLPTADVSVAY